MSRKQGSRLDVKPSKTFKRFNFRCNADTLLAKIRVVPHQILLATTLVWHAKPQMHSEFFVVFMVAIGFARIGVSQLSEEVGRLIGGTLAIADFKHELSQEIEPPS